MHFTIGDRAPAILGAAAAGTFFSLDAQAGRPVAVATLGALEADAAARVLERLRAARPLFQAAGIDAVALAPPDPAFTARFSQDPAARDDLFYVTTGPGLERFELGGEAACVLIDRGGRVADILALSEGVDIAAWLARNAPRVWSEPAQVRASAAPVLFIPNVAPPDLCRALIDHFEGSDHEAGVMASFKDGGAYAKLDEGKKKRRDTELTEGSALYAEVLKVFSGRVIPEIKRAFNSDMVFADRILIARYDDTGGWFKRHRDNAAPHTAFRDFAISLNLNTDEYEGGELSFPEYDDHRYNPPAGGALVFSASLLHEAVPVTRGSRYVLLSFFGGAEAQAKLSGWLNSQQAKAAAS
ncbi:2OG-Fe(II) oxygenase [Phenylobacterium sp.]|uniref:2OG-Fe(II) oxygenase n=1 Tax=Phenylobacterium sp. TaxID=1871053 RepID=UPI002F3FA4E3